jgi:hypothetical protein
MSDTQNAPTNAPPRIRETDSAPTKLDAKIKSIRAERAELQPQIVEARDEWTRLRRVDKTLEGKLAGLLELKKEQDES